MELGATNVRHVELEHACDPRIATDGEVGEAERRRSMRADDQEPLDVIVDG